MLNDIVLSVADQNILFSTDMNPARIEEYFRHGTNPNLKIIWNRSTHKKVLDRGITGFYNQDEKFNKPHQCIIYREIRQDICLQSAVIMLAYLADIHSEKYNSIHGCGMIINSGNKDRGIIVTGNGGTGKSTLGRALGNGRILDDDILMISNNEMFTVARHGAITYETEMGEKMRKYQTKGISRAGIDAIFLLDKQYDGGYIRETDTIPRTYSTLDKLDYGLRDIINSRPPIKVDVPIYILGTRNNVDLTKKAINSVL